MPTKSPGRRGLRVRVRSKGLTVSSTHWLGRQLNDPYVAQAKAKGYRSRAAFKLIELDDKFHFLKSGARVLDLGAAPGGWSQVARTRVGAKGRVLGVDILDIDPLAGVETMKLDLMSAAAPATIRAALSGPADVVLSDMASPTTGHRATDHLRTTALFEAALELAGDVLKPGGVFVGKVFQGGAAPEMLSQLKKSFRDVRHVKPPASRAESVELYLLAMGFRGN
ncbi:MAG: rRNA (uridine2552-2-O)-methyltransferase [Alphaproteobacteria bacterium]|jgi:23S rRNA (uridine2552-2'-O)-methyltransferase|nr:rRNA (uridine2552-2-O)-methyltransferase [Alphaproteobacteria bacterium]